MNLMHCTACHHEWETSKNADHCAWCHAKGHIIHVIPPWRWDNVVESMFARIKRARTVNYAPD